MAYKVKLYIECYKCTRRATYEVFNRVNASMGFYCVKHAKQRVKELNHQGA